MKRHEQGFTLVEMMIVVAILGLIAAIAIPNLLRARLNAADRAICGELRTFSSGNESFRAAQNPNSYSATVNGLITSTPAYLDATWAAAARHGFNMTYSVAAAPSASYSMVAAPTIQGGTGLNTFCIDQTGVIVTSDTDGTANIPTGNAAGCTGGNVLA